MGEIEHLYDHFLKAGKVCTDNRKLEKGSIFFALKGPNFDGNQFALKAIQDGASLAVVDDPGLEHQDDCFYTDDVLTTLQNLANHHRHQLDIPVLAITGSNGKTTSKELINAVLNKKFKVLATAGNLNNHIGVPLTLLSITKKHQFAIIEMGANHIGEIAELCKIADPEYGLITNIGEAHLEGFGSIDGVLTAKTELYRHIEKKGKLLFVNSDDQKLMSSSENIERFTYGKRAADFIYNINESTDFSAISVAGSNLISQLVGNYNCTNLAAAAAIGVYFDIEKKDIAEAFKSYTPGNHRSQLKETGNNTLVIDTYNANPSSMTASITEFTKNGSINKIAILGDMFELGPLAERKHAEIMSLLISKGLQAILVGKEFNKVSGHYLCFENAESLIEALKENPIRGKKILLKGSRGMQLEKLIPHL